MVEAHVAAGLVVEGREQSPLEGGAAHRCGPADGSHRRRAAREQGNRGGRHPPDVALDRIPGLVVQHPRAEADDHHTLLGRQHQVGGTDVAVDHAVGLQVAHGLPDLVEPRQHCGDGEPRRAAGHQQRQQVDPLHPAAHQHDAVPVDEGVEQRRHRTGARESSQRRERREHQVRVALTDQLGGDRHHLARLTVEGLRDPAQGSRKHHLDHLEVVHRIACPALGAPGYHPNLVSGLSRSTNRRDRLGSRP